MQRGSSLPVALVPPVEDLGGDVRLTRRQNLILTGILPSGIEHVVEAVERHIEDVIAAYRRTVAG